MQNKKVKIGLLFAAYLMLLKEPLPVLADGGVNTNSLFIPEKQIEINQDYKMKSMQKLKLETGTALEKESETPPTIETESETPATESETPETESETPATESETPATESETPTTEPDTPAPEPKPTPKPKRKPKKKPDINTGSGSGNAIAGGGGMGDSGNDGGNSKNVLKHAVEKAEDLVKKKEAELSLLNELLGDDTLHAKTSGIVTKININDGDEIVPGKPVIMIGEQQKKRVEVKVEQNDIKKIEEGQITELVFPAYPDERFTGKVSSKKYKAARDEGAEGIVFSVEIELDDTEINLLEGMTCTVQFVQKKVENVIYVSNKVIQIEDGKQFVYMKKKDGSVEKRQIKGGFSDGVNTEILDGLKVGEIAVIEG